VKGGHELKLSLQTRETLTSQSSCMIPSQGQATESSDVLCGLCTVSTKGSAQNYLARSFVPDMTYHDKSPGLQNY